MRVLIVASYRSYSRTGMAPFVSDQGEALASKGIDIRYFLVKGKGVSGYLKEQPLLKKLIKDFKPDIIHAHFGLCGLLANLQRKVPVVTTYHGSDINFQNSYRFSRFSIHLSKWNIFVSQKLADRAGVRRKYSIIPCGVDKSIFHPMNKVDCRKEMGLGLSGKYILFSKMFSDPVKNYPLAKDAVDLLPFEATLLEFNGYTREQAAKLMNAVDTVIMTSYSEGSPQFIKEALACGCPVVSVDVGDVKDIIQGTEGCLIVERNAYDISKALEYAIAFGKTSGPSMVSRFDNNLVTEQIMAIYDTVKNNY